MARWKLNSGGLTGAVEYTSGSVSGESRWQVHQDETPFLRQAAEDRAKTQKENASGMRKFATIPEIVAIEIKEKYGVDLHHGDFMADVDMKAKFFSIIQTDYPHLVVNKR